MAFTIFVTAPRLAPAGLRILEEAGCRVLFMRDGNSAAEVESTLAGEPVDAIISRTVELSAAAIRCCPTLKVISKHGVGVPNIDVTAATEAGIPVYVTPGANAQSVAELTLGLMLAAARKVTWLDSELRAGRWTRAQEACSWPGGAWAWSALDRSASASPQSRWRWAWRCMRLTPACAARHPSLAWCCTTRLTHCCRCPMC